MESFVWTMQGLMYLSAAIAIWNLHQWFLDQGDGPDASA